VEVLLEKGTDVKSQDKVRGREEGRSTVDWRRRERTKGTERGRVGEGQHWREERIEERNFTFL
jgi:hypothetical protein